MKVLSVLLSVFVALSLVSCQQNGEEPHEKLPAPAPAQTQTQTQTQTQPQASQPSSDVAETHAVEVQEVIQGNSYTYLNVKEGDASFWIALAKCEMEVGDTFSYGRGLEMRDFTSKELERTFDTIYFVSKISKDTPAPVENHPEISQPKPEVEAVKISVEPADGGITLAELFSNREAYADKTVLIRGQVTKVNPAIMGTNWIHLQDGTGEGEPHDLVITTDDEITSGEIVTFEGTVTLKKDFGAGYSYEIIMEKAKAK